MDVYHKVLKKLYEITGGKDTVDVDLVELLKREGFYPSIDSILKHMTRESWVTETSRENVVRITHWGVGEARRANSDTPDSALEIARHANRLLSETREFLIVLEEFISRQTGENIGRVDKKFLEMSAVLAKLKENV